MRFRAAIVALQALQCAMRSQLSHEVAFVRMRFRAAIVLDAELRCEDLGRMRVQPQLVFLDHSAVATDADAAPWGVFTKNLPSHRATPPAASGAGPPAAGAISGELLAQFPWLAQGHHAAGGEARSAQRPSTHQAEPPEDEGGELDLLGEPQEADTGSVWQELYDARKGLREDAHVEPTSFRCSILGGAWTKANRGLSYDAYRGRAQGAEVENWSRRAGLTMSAALRNREFAGPVFAADER